MVLLGPSGSGKTTLLRLVAGFERPDEGRVWIGDKVVSNNSTVTPPYRRNFGMVFQDLALWPHMNVEENLKFGLTSKKISRKEKLQQVKDVLELVHLDKHWNYYPHQLSGGEKQRVALARALVLKPEVLLLDEPLSSLDPLLKDKLQELIVNIHNSLEITTIYVTHDQIEAKTLGTKVTVIDRGEIKQTGTYKELVNNPKDEFVKRFIRV